MNKSSQMPTDFTIHTAKRQGVIPLVGIWGGTGGGKTNTGLLFARGLAGPKGRIGVVDTEHGRSKYFADTIPGGFEHIDFPEPYSPERYLDALELLEKSCDVGIVDSLTHLWEGPDGIIDLHEQALDRMTKGSTDWKDRERLNWPAWREPKSRYKTVRDKILRFKIPLIVCLRGEQKSRLVKDAQGRNAVITDADTSPVFDRKFIFEMHVAMEVVQKDGHGGYIKFTPPFAKCSHEDIRRLLPGEGMAQLGIEHGERFARWCAGDNLSAPCLAGQKPATGAGGVSPALVALKKQFWLATDQIHHGIKDKLAQYLWDENLLELDRTLEDLTEPQLRAVFKAICAKLHVSPPTI